MIIKRDERKLDFHGLGLAIKKAREASGLTQEQLAYIVDRTPRTIMYNENNGQHPSLNSFYQMVTMFNISVDQYFFSKENRESGCRKHIDVMLDGLTEKELQGGWTLDEQHASIQRKNFLRGLRSSIRQ